MIDNIQKPFTQEIAAQSRDIFYSYERTLWVAG
jgi:hypothetical protein